jgi:hypothetical protein
MGWMGAAFVVAPRVFAWWLLDIDDWSISLDMVLRLLLVPSSLSPSDYSNPASPLESMSLGREREYLGPFGRWRRAQMDAP